MVEIRETLDVGQMVLSKDIVTDAVRSGARIFRTPREVSSIGRDSTTPKNRNTVVAAARSTSPVKICHITIESPSQNRNQDIVNPIEPVSPQWIRNAKRLKTSINGFLQKIEVLNQFLVR